MTATDRGRRKTNVTLHLTTAGAAVRSLQNTKWMSSWLPSEDFREADKWEGILSTVRCCTNAGTSLDLSQMCTQTPYK